MQHMMQMLGTRVLVLPDVRAGQTESGIYLPDSAQKKPVRGTVVAVGEGRRLDNGTLVPLKIEEGQRVLYGKYGGTEVELESVEHIILDIDSIYAILGPVKKELRKDTPKLVEFEIVDDPSYGDARRKLVGRCGQCIIQPEESVAFRYRRDGEPDTMPKGGGVMDVAHIEPPIVIYLPKIHDNGHDVEGLLGKVIEISEVPKGFVPVLDCGI